MLLILKVILIGIQNLFPISSQLCNALAVKIRCTWDAKKSVRACRQSVLFMKDFPRRWLSRELKKLIRWQKVWGIRWVARCPSAKLPYVISVHPCYLVLTWRNSTPLRLTNAGSSCFSACCTCTNSC